MKIACLKKLSANLRKFTYNDSGVVIVFVALAAIPVLAFAGLAVDAGRTYYAQTVLSGAVDAAAIAAGRQSDPTKATAEANMVFNANIPAGFIGTLSANPLTVTISGTQVTVTSSATVPTTLLQLVGQNTANVTATALVDRELSGLELVLVMDNTGSMSSNNKMTSMKAAANALLDVIYNGKTSLSGVYVSLVPYTTTVNIGTYAQEPARWANWLTSAAKTKTSPPGFTPGQFWTTSGSNKNPKVSVTAKWTGCVENRLDNAMFPNNDGEGDDTTPGASDVTRWGVFDNTLDSGCPLKMTGLQSNITNIRTAINNMTPNGWTSIPIGLAWGWRMLSPQWRNFWNDSSSPATLPQDYKKTSKAIVILTDGVNEIGGYSGYGPLAEARLGSTNYAVIQNTLNTKLANLCTRIKAQGITIYTITLMQNNATVQNILRNCATMPSYYFNSPSSSDLQGIFQNIGSSLQQLRFRTPGAK